MTLTFGLLVLVGVVIGTIGAIVIGVRKSGDDYAASNQVVPGVPTNAPAAWAGAHSPEARLHRRLRDAVAAGRSNPALDDLALADARTTLETHALALDERLVAVAALPDALRTPRLAEIEGGVAAIEDAVAQLVDLRGARPADIEAGLAEVRTRVALVAEARAEIDAIDATSSSFKALQDEIEAASTAAATAAPEPASPPPPPVDPTPEPPDPDEGQTSTGA